MKFKLHGFTYEGTWKLGNKSIPVTVHDLDSKNADLIKPFLPAIEPLLEKWKGIRKEAVRILQKKGLSCAVFEPKSVLISVSSTDDIGDFHIKVPLVEYLPDEELIARITGDLDGDNIAVEIDSDF